VDGTSRGQGVIVEQEVIEESLCRHHWVIDTPDGPVSTGVCRLCGEQREFKNFLEGTYWDDDTSLVLVSTGGRYPKGMGSDGEASSEE